MSRPAGHSGRRAMTLVEVLMAMVLLAAVLGGALSAVGLSTRAQHATAEMIAARTLAADLLEMVCGYPYEDPTDLNEFGPGIDENAASKATFNDLDDFDGWTESPPERYDGTPIASAGAWTRTVAVEWVNPLTPGIDAGAETGVKRVTVTVSKAGADIATMSRLRARATDATGK